MSTKNSMLVTLVNAQSGATTITSNPIKIQWLNNIGIQYTWTGTLTGTLSAQVSNDSTNWVNRTLTVVPTNPAGSASSSYGELTDCGAAYMRLVYTASSGTGNMTIIVCAKES